MVGRRSGKKCGEAWVFSPGTYQNIFSPKCLKWPCTFFFANFYYYYYCCFCFFLSLLTFTLFQDFFLSSHFFLFLFVILFLSLSSVVHFSFLFFFSFSATNMHIHVVLGGAFFISLFSFSFFCFYHFSFFSFFHWFSNLACAFKIIVF